jgi:wyosine [tRNA(Phe)-imidazoG37] synthetase (radical SAM superfamily)
MVAERKSWIDPELILAQVKRALTVHTDQPPNWVTFVGSGETTLHADLGWMIRRVKELTPQPVAVITNGSTLFNQAVREALAHADAVLPALDAGTQDLYRRINRPHPSVPYEDYVEGLCEFRSQYEGWLWPEIMLLDGINDSVEALEALASLCSRIRPDRLHLALPTRPPAEAWVRPSTTEGLMRAQVILGETAKVIHPASGDFELKPGVLLVGSILEIIERHPMRVDELERILARRFPDQKERTLRELEASRGAKVIERRGVKFWVSSQAVFPEDPADGRI